MKTASLCLLSGAILGAGLSTNAAAGGLVINFEEFPAYNNGTSLTNEYAGIGVLFNSADDAVTWGGIGNGDPGNWFLEGTNGSQFLGFNGPSHSASMLFDSSIDSFMLDAARGGFGSGGTMTIDGYLNGGLVDSMSITFGNVNEWSTLSLSGAVDEVVMYGSGIQGFGVDNIHWNKVPAPSSVALLGLGGLVATRRRR
jgi:hypothetical protein